MKKIIVIGPSGAGKSVFSRKLGEILNLKVYHLDNIWWKSDKTHISRDEFDLRLQEIIENDEWIIDGDYSRTYEIRIKNADTVFFLNFPLDVCLMGASSRVGTKRDDLPWVENEFDPEFKEWIINWHNTTLPKVKDLIDKYKHEKNIIEFSSRDEANKFLLTLQ